MHNSMRVSQWVENRFNLSSLNLTEDCVEDFRMARQKCLLENQLGLGSNLSEHQFTSGIRVGLDFLRRPTSKERFLSTTQNKCIMIDQVEKIKADIELGIRKLVVNQAEIYMKNGEDDHDSGTMFGLYGSDEDRIQHGLSEAIHLSLFFVYQAGRCDGIEDGRNMLKTIFGQNPSETSWYPFVNRSTTHVAGNNHGFGAIEPFYDIPVQVQSGGEREYLHQNMLNSVQSSIKSVELLVAKLVKFRLELFLLGKEPEAGNRSQLELHKNVSRCAKRIYRLGHYCGFESGQNSIKSLYNHCYRDTNTYILIGRDSSARLLVDTSVPVACECSTCPKCIERRTKEKRLELQNDWEQTAVDYDCYFNKLKTMNSANNI